MNTKPIIASTAPITPNMPLIPLKSDTSKPTNRNSKPVRRLPLMPPRAVEAVLSCWRAEPDFCTSLSSLWAMCFRARRCTAFGVRAGMAAGAAAGAAATAPGEAAGRAASTAGTEGEGVTAAACGLAGATGAGAGVVAATEGAATGTGAEARYPPWYGAALLGSRAYSARLQLPNDRAQAAAAASGAQEENMFFIKLEGDK